ncbi:MAG: L-threonylcarbamoyladenylate synthase [Brooklawnia sp.]|jgi:tRNA threonylcarbamoyl adenosine modification protein (Sua5/YciO/YrdC/YwlC family)
MARYFDVHPENPQQRALDQTVEVLRDGGVIAYPTDSGFALGALFGNHQAADRIRAIRDLDERHHLTIVVSEFGQIGRYVVMSNRVFRAVKAATPGAYTFILPATREVPRVMQHPRKRTIGIRVPQHTTTLALLDALGEPLASSTLILPGQEEPMTDGWQINEELGHVLDAIVDSGDVGLDPTTVVDLTEDEPVITRLGGGDPALFEV